MELYDEDEFYRAAGGARGRDTYCKRCRDSALARKREARSNWRKTHKTRRPESKRLEVNWLTGPTVIGRFFAD